VTLLHFLRFLCGVRCDPVGQRVEFGRAAAAAADQRFLGAAEGSRVPLIALPALD